MVTMTVAAKLTKKMVKAIDELVKEGYYTNRSDALRDAARIMLSIQSGIYNSRAKKISKDKILKSFAAKKGFKL